jgi:hypothetical protein
VAGAVAGAVLVVGGYQQYFAVGGYQGGTEGHVAGGDGALGSVDGQLHGGFIGVAVDDARGHDGQFFRFNQSRSRWLLTRYAVDVPLHGPQLFLGHRLARSYYYFAALVFDRASKRNECAVHDAFAPLLHQGHHVFG